MTILDVQSVVKHFRFYSSSLSRLTDRLFNRDSAQVFTALHDVSFKIASGESVALMGMNGAGKSTLLKIIMGILTPDQGKVVQQGSVTGLLELGTGFDAELSGRDNITINGLLIGMTAAEIEAKVSSIIDFSELQANIDHPVKTYSSGMIMRLGFSIAIHAEPSCFIVDEALAVGDARFQQKCIQRMKAFQQQGGALLYVSHDLNSVKMLCDRAILLHQGKVAAQGATSEVAEAYYSLLGNNTQHNNDDEIKQLHIRCAYFTNEAGEVCQVLTPLARYRLCIDVESHQATAFTLGFMIKDRFGQEVFGTNTYLLDKKLVSENQQEYTVIIDFACHLGPGQYTLAASLHRGASHVEGCFHWLDHALTFEVHAWQGYPFVGLAVQSIHSVDMVKITHEPQ